MSTHISFEVATLASLYKLAKQGVFTHDTAIFWPGWKPVLKQRLARLSDVAVIAYTANRKPVCWCSFSRNPLDKTSWRYGNLVTLPEFRRQGLATAVVDFGIGQLAARGGRRVYCFVDENNIASIGTHEKLGFRPSGFVKSVTTRRFEPAFGGKWRAIDRTRAVTLIESSAGVRERGVADGKDLLQFILAGCSLLPWKKPADNLILKEFEPGNYLIGKVVTGTFVGYYAYATNIALPAQAIVATVPEALSSYAIFHDVDRGIEHFASDSCFHTYVRAI